MSVKSLLVSTAITPGSASASRVSIETNARMRVGTAQKLSFDHAGNDQIADILRLAGDFIDAVDARHRVADHGKTAFIRLTQHLLPT